MTQQTPFHKRIINLATYFLGSMLVFQIPIMIFYLNSYSLEEVLTYHSVSISFYSTLIGAIILIFVNWLELLEQFKKIKWNKTFVTILKYYAMIMISNVVTSVVLSYLAGIDSATNQTSIEASLQSLPLITILSVVVLAPFVEEMVFRYSLMNVDSDKKDLKLVWWIISSAIFGGMHLIATITSGQLNELWFFFQYFAMGLIIGHSYLKTKNIWVPTLLHLFSNGIATLAILFL